MGAMFPCLRFILVLLALAAGARAEAPARPTLFLIGDSTVKNAVPGQLGWGRPFGALFDPVRIQVENRALSGRSSRTYQSDGLWERVRAQLAPGDFVLIQFGHNDGGPLDAGKARGSLPGNGDDTQAVTHPQTGASETVYSYGWYLRRCIAETRARGATPIVCSPVPRHRWRDGRIVRATADYARWAREAAAQGGAHFLDLNELVARRYEELGPERVRLFFTDGDETHTSPRGAECSAVCAAEGLRALAGCELASTLRREHPMEIFTSIQSHDPTPGVASAPPHP